MAKGVSISSAPTGLSVQLNEKTGAYRLTATSPAWVFGGDLGSAAASVQKSSGRDQIGEYQQLTFTWQDSSRPLEGVIRIYQGEPLALFQYTYQKAANPPSVAFPDFNVIPANLHHFSYRNAAFAPPQFELGQYGTPWLLFDDSANAMVISPASHFIIASMHGDGDHQIASGLNDELPGVPEGFTQQTLVAIAPGIRKTWAIWGSALTDLGGKKRPGNESDITLKYFGYWTDNGAYYYYRNFDPDLGYAGTLEKVISQYREEKIPVHYLQLDSWWYDKSYPGMNPDDHTGRWNAFGGIMRYAADPTLFPQGLAAFHQTVGLPFVTHSRWISRFSPYRQNYEISGVAPVGMKWWDDIAAYLKSSGVITYEQDWQSLIDQRSPAFRNTINTGDNFYNDMAEACQNHGLTMQYCMALPCDFLEGSRYSNLTTIRTSDDRFSRARWRDFLYVSQLADAIGSWPWTDVYFSYEKNNLLLDTLSAGPVGTGDELGTENRKDIMKAVRADGVIVKPDVPITPLDRMYIADANPRTRSFASMAPQNLAGRARGADSPFIASAWTDDGPIRTAYVFAFSRSGAVHQTVRFSPEEAGSASPAGVYNYFTHQVSRVESGQTFEAMIGPEETGYYIVAPIGPNGMALFGDKGKFASMGKERIASLEEGTHSIKAQLLLAPGEDSITLFGDAPAEPSVTVQDGSARDMIYRKSDGYFSVQVSPAPDDPAVTVDGDPVRRVTVDFKQP